MPPPDALKEVQMNRRASAILRAVTLAVLAAGLSACAVYPGRPYGYGYGHGYRSQAYAYSAPAYRPGWGGGWGRGYGGGWGHGGGWR
jgi:hypothetical protein